MTFNGVRTGLDGFGMGHVILRPVAGAGMTRLGDSVMTRWTARAVLLTFFLTGCGQSEDVGDDDTTGDDPGDADRDGDGTLDGEDCAPDDPSIHPEALEGCDDIDQDCDGDPQDDGAVSLAGEPALSLDDAVRDAASGEAIRLCAGTYRAQLDLEKDLVIEGAGAGLTVLDGDEEGTVVEVVGATVTLRGLTVSDGMGEAHGILGDSLGGGLYLAGGADVTLDGCSVEGNEAVDGAGIHAAGGSVLTFVDTEITGNRADYRGGGLRVEVEGELDLGGADIHDNEAAFGAGMFVVPAGAAPKLVFDPGVPVTGNEADTSGGVAYIDAGSPMEVEGLWATGNYASYGAALYTETSLTVRGAVLEQNEAASNSGGIYFFGAAGTSRLVGTAVRDNTATYCTAFTFQVGSDGPARLEADAETVIEGNEAAGAGSGACVFEDEGVLGDATLSGLRFSEGTSPYSALLVRADGAVTIEDTAVTSNGSTGIYLYGTGLVDLRGVHVAGNEGQGGAGGGLRIAPYADGFAVTADADTLVEGNSDAEGAGGVSISGSGEKGLDHFAVSVTGLTVEGNTGALGGGFAVEDSDATLSDIVVSGNEADDGGGIAVSAADVTLTDCVVTGNDASQDGGGLWVDADGLAAVTRGAIRSNQAGAHGGGAWLADFRASFSDTDLGSADTDNAPDDVWIEVADLSVLGQGAGATFACDGVDPACL